jgi:hypothetical protein
MSCIRAIKIPFVCLLFFLAFNIPANAGFLKSAKTGLRFGVSDKFRRNNREYDAFYIFKTPWNWKIFFNWPMDVRLALTAGVSSIYEETVFIGSAGPEFVISMFNKTLYFNFGSSAAFVTRDQFDNKNLGGAYQFISHGGLGLRIFKRIIVAGHYQHISNADIYGGNDGLDQYMVELGYLFSK